MLLFFCQYLKVRKSPVKSGPENVKQKISRCCMIRKKYKEPKVVEIIIAGISVLGTIAVTIINVVANSKRAKSDMQKNLCDGVQALLRSDIIADYKEYMAKGYCPIYAKESLKKKYSAYHGLGGNDVATGLYQDVMKLPSEERIESNED